MRMRERHMTMSLMATRGNQWRAAACLVPCGRPPPPGAGERGGRTRWPCSSVASRRCTGRLYTGDLIITLFASAARSSACVCARAFQSTPQVQQPAAPLSAKTRHAHTAHGRTPRTRTYQYHALGCSALAPRSSAARACRDLAPHVIGDCPTLRLLDVSHPSAIVSVRHSLVSASIHHWQHHPQGAGHALASPNTRRRLVTQSAAQRGWPSSPVVRTIFVRPSRFSLPPCHSSSAPRHARPPRQSSKVAVVPDIPLKMKVLLSGWY